MIQRLQKDLKGKDQVHSSLSIVFFFYQISFLKEAKIPNEKNF